MIREGQEVEVVDNDTGEDLTAITLTQVIMESEKREHNFIPHSILTDLIRTGGKSLKTIREKLPSPPDLIQKVDQEISDRLETLIHRGEIAEEEGIRLRDQLISEGKRWLNNPQITDIEIEYTLLAYGFATRKDYERILTEIESVSAKIDSV